MRTFAYNDLGQDDPVVITETELFDQYWIYWSGAMLKRGGLSPRITETNCIEDFMVVHWAWETTSENL